MLTMLGAPTAVIIVLTSAFVYGWGVFMQVLTQQGRHTLADGQVRGVSIPALPQAYSSRAE